MGELVEDALISTSHGTSRKHGKKEPQSFSHCGSFDHHDV
jgi:hypothetical protein